MLNKLELYNAWAYLLEHASAVLPRLYPFFFSFKAIMTDFELQRTHGRRSPRSVCPINRRRPTIGPSRLPAVPLLHHSRVGRCALLACETTWARWPRAEDVWRYIKFFLSMSRVHSDSHHLLRFQREWR